MLVGVKCPYYRKNIKFKECLECAAKDAPCGIPYGLLKAGSVMMTKPRLEVHVTDLCGCLRRAYFSKVADYYEDPGDWIAAILGIFIHSKMESFTVEGSHTELSLTATTLGGVEVVGTVDLLTNGTIEDWKSRRWLDPSKCPSSSHARQINIYRWMLIQNGYEANAGVVNYLALSGATRCRTCKCALVQQEDGEWECPECHNTWPKDKVHRGVYRANVDIYPLDKVESWIDNKAQLLNNALQTGEIMPKVDSGGEWVCDYCSFQSECEAFDELEKMKEKTNDR